MHTTTLSHDNCDIKQYTCMSTVTSHKPIIVYGNHQNTLPRWERYPYIGIIIIIILYNQYNLNTENLENSVYATGVDTITYNRASTDPIGKQRLYMCSISSVAIDSINISYKKACKDRNPQ